MARMKQKMAGKERYRATQTNESATALLAWFGVVGGHHWVVEYGKYLL